MLAKDFLETRRSVRDFLEKEITKEDKDKIFELLDKEAEKLGKDDVSFLASTDGKTIYESLSGIAGYYGVMIKAPMYIGLNVLNNKEKTFVLGAYGMEELITQISKLGIATCWVAVTDVAEEVKQSVFNFTSGQVNHLLAIGYASDDSVIEHRYDDRKGVTDFVFIDDFDNPASVEELEDYGLDDLFTYARFAPNTLNAQPWRFLIKGSEIELYIEDYKGNENLIDAGIIMYYVDELAKNISKDRKWEINPDLNGNRYQFIAKTRL